MVYADSWLWLEMIVMFLKKLKINLLDIVVYENLWELIFVDLPKVSLSRILKNVALDILKVNHVYNEIHKN